MTEKAKKAISAQIDRLCKEYNLPIAVFVYVAADGHRQIVSRSESPTDSAHMLMSAAEHLHMMDIKPNDPIVN